MWAKPYNIHHVLLLHQPVTNFLIPIRHFLWNILDNCSDLVQRINQNSKIHGLLQSRVPQTYGDLKSRHRTQGQKFQLQINSIWPRLVWKPDWRLEFGYEFRVSKKGVSGLKVSKWRHESTVLLKWRACIWKWRWQIWLYVHKYGCS